MQQRQDLPAPCDGHDLLPTPAERDKDQQLGGHLILPTVSSKFGGHTYLREDFLLFVIASVCFSVIKVPSGQRWAWAYFVWLQREPNELLHVREIMEGEDKSGWPKSGKFRCRMLFSLVYLCIISFAFKLLRWWVQEFSWWEVRFVRLVWAQAQLPVWQSCSKINPSSMLLNWGP